jgi:hypothetical protein
MADRKESHVGNPKNLKMETMENIGAVRKFG